MLGGDGGRSSSTRDPRPAQAREILDDLRELGSPRVGDRRQHARPLRPRIRQLGLPARASIWGHERCATMIRLTGEAQRASRPRGGPGRSPTTSPRSSSTRPTARSPIARRSTSTAARSSSPTSGAATPTTTSWSRSPTPTCCAPATCSRTARRPGSATATRWTGRRRLEALLDARRRADGRRPGPRRARRSGVRRARRSRRSGAIADLARASTRASWTSRRRSPRRPYRPAAARGAARAGAAQLRGELDRLSRYARQPALAGDAHHPAAARLAVDDRVERGLERRRGRPP